MGPYLTRPELFVAPNNKVYRKAREPDMALGHPEQLIAALLATTFAETTSSAYMDLGRTRWAAVQFRRDHRTAAMDPVRRVVLELHGRSDANWTSS
jgi:hypothetical protein